MIYDEEYMDENYDRLIKTDTYIKALISKVNLPSYKDDKLLYTLKYDKDIALYDYDDFLNNNKYYFDNFETVRLNHITKKTIDRLKKDIDNGLISNKIFTKSSMYHRIKYIDDDILNFNGKKFRVERWNKNHYDKMNLEILTEYKNIDDVIKLLDSWGEKKRKSGGVSMHGYDKNFFNQYYKDVKTRLGDNFLSLFFYHNGVLIGFTTMERSNNDFWIIHSRKCNSVDYPNLNLYIDIFAYRKIWETYRIPFYINIGYESGKRCDYKLKRFPNHSQFKSFHVKFINNNVKTIF